MTKFRTALPLFCISLGVAPVGAMADACSDYPLSPEQASYLETESLDVAVPEGEVPVVQRCDVDGNNVINNDDLFIIRSHRGEPAAHPDDPMDWDGDGVIHGRDVGGCASACNSAGGNGCAVKEGDAEEEDGVIAAAQIGAMESVAEPGGCYQIDDVDGDGNEDFVGMFEHTGDDIRGGDWELEVVILTKDADGNVQHKTFPYTGQKLDGELTQHLSKQPAGVVDLNPGSITIDQPGVVSYRDGEPKVIFYYVDGVLTRSFYGIDD